MPQKAATTRSINMHVNGILVNSSSLIFLSTYLVLLSAKCLTYKQKSWVEIVSGATLLEAQVYEIWPDILYF